MTFFFVSCSYIILLEAKCRKKCSYEISRSSLVTFRLFHSHTSSVHSRSFTHARASKRVSQYFLFSFFPFFLPFILSLFLELFISTVSFMDFSSQEYVSFSFLISHTHTFSRVLSHALCQNLQEASSNDNRKVGQMFRRLIFTLFFR